jgi:hypothetical protein
MPAISSSRFRKGKPKENPIDKYRFIHHFVPHPHHRTRARFLSTKAIVLYCMVFLLILGGFKVFAKMYPGVLGYASDITVSQLLKYTNQRRAETGASELRLNPALMKAAEMKARDMFEHGYWAHVSPSGVEPWDFILAENYDYSHAGENLAKNFSNSREVVNAWYGSPTHRENLLNKNYEEIGFAVVNGVLEGYETTLVVQLFGKPRNPAYLASAQDEQRILESATVVDLEPTISIEPIFPIGGVAVAAPRDYHIEANIATKYLIILFGVFITILLCLDVWYSRRHSIFKMSGHTLAHLSLLIITIVGMLFLLSPGRIL